MKDLYPGYYRPTQDEFDELWKTCIFILDTNILLNLYRYDEQTRQDFFKLLDEIKDRLWIPHQVGLEFQENRIQVIKAQENKIHSLREQIMKHSENLRNELNNFPSINSGEFFEKYEQLVENFLQKAQTSDSFPFKSKEYDLIRERIDQIFQGRVGNPPSQEELKSIEQEGEERYKIKYPPGYEDAKDKKNSIQLCNNMAFQQKYGDLILWKEILKEVKARSWKSVIFVTDDNKEDWWRKENGETIGPRPELIEEAYKNGLSIFYMYKPRHFLQYAAKYIHVKVKEESIQQVEEISDINNRSEDIEKNLIEVLSKPYNLAILKWLRLKYPSAEISSYDSRGYIWYIQITDGTKIAYNILYIKKMSWILAVQIIRIKINDIKRQIKTANFQEVNLVCVFLNESSASKFISNFSVEVFQKWVVNFNSLKKVILGILNEESQPDGSAEKVFHPLFTTSL